MPGEKYPSAIAIDQGSPLSSPHFSNDPQHFFHLEKMVINDEFDNILALIESRNSVKHVIDEIIKNKKLNAFSLFLESLEPEKNREIKECIKKILGCYLFSAVENNNDSFLCLLLSMGADRSVLLDNMTPMRKAVDLKCWRLVDVFADYAVNKESNCDYDYALFKAVESDEIERALKLVEAGADVNYCESDMSALFYATKKREYGLMRSLIKRNALHQINGENSRFAWEYAVENEDTVGMVVFIHSKSASLTDILNKIILYGKVSFFHSLSFQFEEQKKLDYIQYLQNENELFNALQQNDPGLVETLLGVGVDQTILNAGKSAVYCAVRTDIENNGNALTTVFSTLPAKENSAIAVLYGQAALYAAKQNKFELVLLLVNANACLKQTNSASYSILHFAVLHNADAFLEKLSDAQFHELIMADVASPCAWKIAFTQQHSEIVFLFMLRGIAVAAILNYAKEENSVEFFCNILDFSLGNESYSTVLLPLNNQECDFLLRKSIAYRFNHLQEKILDKTTAPSDPINELFAIKKSFFDKNKIITKSLLEKIISKLKLALNEDFHVQLSQFVGRLSNELLSNDETTVLIMIIEDYKRRNKDNVTDLMMLSILEASPNIINANEERVLPRDAMSAVTDFFAYEMIMSGKAESTLTLPAAFTFIAERHPDLTRDDIQNAFRNPAPKVAVSRLYRFTAGLAGSAASLVGSAASLVWGSGSEESSSPRHDH
ncbi:MAG: hypothetical protein NTZ67_09245 [Gammaproteobacteria bacterium]|nr:hypothetical protein [Gammaproteobacteria bacterium]